MIQFLKRLTKFLPIAAGAIGGALTVAAYATGFWSTAVEAGLKDKDGQRVYATRGEHQRTLEQIAALDAGTAKKDDVTALKQEMKEMRKDLKDEMNEQTKLIIRALKNGR